MSENHLVRCTKKSGDEITHIGGTNSDGKAWSMSVQDAVRGLKSGHFKYYVLGANGGIWLGVAQERGRDTLKPTGEGVDPSLLHQLPDCP